MLAPGPPGQAIVNFAERPAQSANINRRFGKTPAFLKKVKLRQQFLRLAHGKDGHEHRAALGKSLFQRQGQPFDFPVAGKAFGTRLRAARRLDDQDVDIAGKFRRAHECLVGEIDITRVKNRAPAMMQRRSHRT